MKKIVADNSVIMSWLFNDEGKKGPENLLTSCNELTIHVPSLWLYELTNVLFVAEKKNRIKEADSIAFLNFLKLLPIKLEHNNYDIVTKNVLAISRGHNITVYDASYAELAIRKNMALASFDKDLIAVCKIIGIEILEF